MTKVSVKTTAFCHIYPFGRPALRVLHQMIQDN